jgi:hypothetical protein
LTPTHTRRKGKLYRYYVTTSVLKIGPEACPIQRVSAAEIERAVIDQYADSSAPELVVCTWIATNEERCLRSWTGKQSSEPFSSPRRHSAVAGSCQ